MYFKKGNRKMELFYVATGVMASVLIPYDTYVTNRPRVISTIENDGVVYTIEILPVAFWKYLNVLPHSHTLRKVTPDTPRKNALVYFTVERASIFESIPVAYIQQWGVHNHRCKWTDNCKEKVYYIGKDLQIYDHSTEQSYTYMPNFIMHTHMMQLLNIRNSTTNSAKPSAKHKGQNKSASSQLIRDNRVTHW